MSLVMFPIDWPKSSKHFSFNVSFHILVASQILMTVLRNIWLEEARICWLNYKFYYVCKILIGFVLQTITIFQTVASLCFLLNATKQPAQPQKHFRGYKLVQIMRFSCCLNKAFTWQSLSRPWFVCLTLHRKALRPWLIILQMFLFYDIVATLWC